jgi:anaphase-promoting complex subunit 4
MSLGNAYVFPCIKIASTDPLKGQRRWDKAVTTGYENVRRLTQENLIPALERFTVVISRLRGLARAQESTASLGLATAELDRIIDTASCLHLFAHSILLASCAELRLFTAFSAWMKYEIGHQAADPQPTMNEETEKDVPSDYRKVLEYVQGPMMSSQLSDFFAMHSSGGESNNMEKFEENDLIYEGIKKELRGLKSEKGPRSGLPHLEQLFRRLKKQCQVVFERIAETEKRKVHFGKPLVISVNSDIMIEMRMKAKVRDGVSSGGTLLTLTFQDGREDTYSAYIAFAEQSPSSIGNSC